VLFSKSFNLVGYKNPQNNLKCHAPVDVGHEATPEGDAPQEEAEEEAIILLKRPQIGLTAVITAVDHKTERSPPGTAPGCTNKISNPCWPNSVVTARLGVQLVTHDQIRRNLTGALHPADVALTRVRLPDTEITLRTVVGRAAAGAAPRAADAAARAADRAMRAAGTAMMATAGVETAIDEAGKATPATRAGAVTVITQQETLPAPTALVAPILPSDHATRKRQNTICPGLHQAAVEAPRSVKRHQSIMLLTKRNGKPEKLHLVLRSAASPRKEINSRMIISR
jgi:hypothetical protein